MNKLLYPAALVAGLGAVAWVGAGHGLAHPLALAVTLLIAAAYLAGAWELQRFRQASAALRQALAAPPAEALAPWIAALPPALQLPVQRRIDGERAALPAPALTPYLVGLLVLLGMVGTFLGMVVTLQGTVSALESTADLQAMRAALAAPVRGLGFAFGTSVAGVCASAALGLLSALARRERLQVLATLDAACAGVLRPFSARHRREQGWQQLQDQAAQVPLLVDGVKALMAQLAEQQAATNTQWLAGQDRFHREAAQRYGELAGAVEASLKASLADGARVAAETLQPAVQRTLAGLAEQAAAVQAESGRRVQQQAEATAAALQATLAQAERQLAERSGALVEALAARFGEQSQALVHTLDARQAAWADQRAALDARQLAAWTTPLEQMAERLQADWQRAGEQALAQQRQVCEVLAATADGIGTRAQAHAEATIAEVTRLMQTAAEAPRAAAEVIGQLRAQLSASVAHDNALLEERRSLLERMAALVQAVEAGAARQQQAMDGLVAAATDGLADAGRRFDRQVAAGAEALADAAAQGVAGAAESAALAEAFGLAVQRYADANDRLVGHLQRVEAALDQAAARSDEQLAYVVAQAREVIDLSLLSQKQILEELRQIERRQPQLADAAG